jgi:signal transduction histidine kinase
MSADELARERAAVDLLRRRIVNVVGHELKLPVSTIRGLAEALSSATPEQVHDEIAPALVRSTARLERLVDDLLLASGVFTVLPVEQAETRAVEPVVERVWAAVAGERELQVDSTNEHTLVRTRADALERILAAVLDNAAKYGEPPYAVRTRSSGAVVTIEVSSTGTPGPADLALALEPFYRGEEAVTAAPGLGIGLAVAAALAAQDGGRVSVRVEVDRMVTAVELPVG